MAMRTAICDIQGFGYDAPLTLNMLIVVLVKDGLFTSWAFFVELSFLALLEQVLVDEFDFNALLTLLAYRDQGTGLKPVNVAEVLFLEPFVVKFAVFANVLRIFRIVLQLLFLLGSDLTLFWHCRFRLFYLGRTGLNRGFYLLFPFYQFRGLLSLQNGRFLLWHPPRTVVSRTLHTLLPFEGDATCFFGCLVFLCHSLQNHVPGGFFDIVKVFEQGVLTNDFSDKGQ